MRMIIMKKDLRFWGLFILLFAISVYVSFWLPSNWYEKTYLNWLFYLSILISCFVVLFPNVFIWAEKYLSKEGVDIIKFIAGFITLLYLFNIY